MRGIALPVNPNNDPAAQPDPALRALNAQASAPGPRQQVYCTKIGTTRPDEMYIVGAHMDGRGFGEHFARLGQDRTPPPVRRGPLSAVAQGRGPRGGR